MPHKKTFHIKRLLVIYVDIYLDFKLNYNIHVSIQLDKMQKGKNYSIKKI